MAIVQVLQAIATQAKAAGKAMYIFSIDSEEGKVVHVNYLPKSLISKEFDARIWASRVTAILGGKVSWIDFVL